jgi:hypothetical protein
MPRSPLDNNILRLKENIFQKILLRSLLLTFVSKKTNIEEKEDPSIMPMKMKKYLKW